MPSIDSIVADALVDLASGDPQLTNTNLTYWWNQRQRTLSSQAKWWFMRGSQNVSVTNAGGVGPYSLTGTPQTIEDVFYNGTPLDSIPISQGTIIFPGTGTPTAYGLAPANAGQVPPSIYVYPAPDTNGPYTLNVYTFSRPTDLVYGSGTVNVFTDMFPELVKAAICWAASERLDEPDKIQQWKGKYKEELMPLLQAQTDFDRKGIFSEPHPSFMADPSLLGGQSQGGR